MKFKQTLLTFTALALFVFNQMPVFAQEKPVLLEDEDKPVEVLMDGKRLFSIEASLGPISAKERAKNIENILKAARKGPTTFKAIISPTFNIVRFMIVVFAVMLAFPYLPGSDSPAFQQITIFLGVLFSLGSTGAVAHLIAGIF